jgi:hypothetical protein
MTVATKKEWASVTPFGLPGHKTDFTIGRIAIETLDGTVLNERLNPAGHAEAGKVDAPRDALDRAYFNGYALWTYLTTPFLFAMPGFSMEEIANALRTFPCLLSTSSIASAKGLARSSE